LVKNVIHSLKYEPFLKELATPLAYSIIAHFSLIDNPIIHPQEAKKQKSAQLSPSYIICPVPLHKKRLRWRGFNHTEEIAKVLSAVLSIPTYSDILVRTKNTPAQITLTKEKRLQNMQGAFQAQNKEIIQGKKVLLLDDVFTTGATLTQAASALKKAGASQVFGVVVARGS
jgi:competence protein ComFC